MCSLLVRVIIKVNRCMMQAQQAIVVARQRAEEAKRKGQEAQYAADCIIGPLRDSLDSFTDAVKCIAGAFCQVL